MFHPFALKLRNPESFTTISGKTAQTSTRTYARAACAVLVTKL